MYSFLSSPQKCVVCNKKTLLIPLCAECRKLHYYSKFSSPDYFKNRCTLCGRPLISTSETCHSCREVPVLKNVDLSFPLFSYRLWNKELLFLWKIQGIRLLSPFFASLYAQALKVFSVKYIVPVPPRPGKIKKNGWDQIDEVSKFLSFKYGFCILKLLERTTDFQQKKLGRDDRLKKSESSYCIKGEKAIARELKKCGGAYPSSVCILDDVCTTGSTLESCASILRVHTGIKTIYCMTLFLV